MEIKEAIKIIQAGLAWANWTEEQKDAMNTAIEALSQIQIQGSGQVNTAYNCAMRDYKNYMNDLESDNPYTRHMACGSLNAMDEMNRLFNLKLNFPERG